jgi:hypothetical protein
MDGWLAFHAAFVTRVAAALYRCGTDPARLAADRPALGLMRAAVTEAFAALRRAGVTGLPRRDRPGWVGPGRCRLRPARLVTFVPTGHRSRRGTMAAEATKDQR